MAEEYLWPAQSLDRVVGVIYDNLQYHTTPIVRKCIYSDWTNWDPF